MHIDHLVIRNLSTPSTHFWCPPPVSPDFPYEGYEFCFVLSILDSKYSFKIFLTKAELLGYILCNCSNVSKLLFLGLAAFLFRLCPCPSAGLGAALCCRRLSRAGGFKPWSFFYEPSAEKGAFEAPASQSGTPWWVPYKARDAGSSPGVGTCFLIGHACSWQWGKEKVIQAGSSLCNHCRLL